MPPLQQNSCENNIVSCKNEVHLANNPYTILYENPYELRESENPFPIPVKGKSPESQKSLKTLHTSKKAYIPTRRGTPKQLKRCTHRK